MAPRGGGPKSGGALPKLRILCPKTAFFGPNRPRNPVITAKRRQTAATLHVRLEFTVTKSSLLPPNSTICQRNGPKRRQKAPKSAQCAPTPRNQERAVSWATWLKSEFRGHLVHPQTPTFCGFQASELPNEPPRPPYQWSLGGARGQPSLRTAGANGGSTRVPRGEKNDFFPKLFLDHLGCSNKCFWPVLSPWWRVWGHVKSQNALKMGRFGTNNGSKMGQNRIFPKVILDHMGCSNKCF